MDKKWWITLAVVMVVLLLAGAIWIPYRDSNQVSAYSAKYRLASEHCTGYMELVQTHTSSSNMKISVESLYVEEREDHFLCSGTVTLLIQTEENASLDIYLLCRQSMDNIGSSDTKTVTVKAGIPQQVTFDYTGWNKGGYWIEIGASDHDSQQGSVEIQMY